MVTAVRPLCPRLKSSIPRIIAAPATRYCVRNAPHMGRYNVMLAELHTGCVHARWNLSTRHWQFGDESIGVLTYDMTGGLVVKAAVRWRCERR